jgi:hypothetical protein
VDLKVLNASNQTVAFADITLRYYLSYELTNGAMPAAELDYVQNFQLSQLTRTFSTGYFELDLPSQPATSRRPTAPAR